MPVMAKTPLKAIREGLQPKVSQEQLAHAAGITLATYRNAEGGRNVSYSTATAILRELNIVLAGRNLQQISLEDLGLAIV